MLHLKRNSGTVHIQCQNHPTSEMAVVHLSPELPRLTVRGHKRELTEVPFDFLSASYPSPTDTAAPTQLQRSYSGRPRSQTSEVSVSAAAKTRKSLRHLGRSRVVAGMNSWKGKQAGGSNGSENRRASTSDADEATTEQIDSAFTRIKEQLVSISALMLHQKTHGIPQL